MTPPFDELERRAATQTERDHPQWLIIWGYYSRLYWAYPRFHTAPGTIITAPDTAELTTRIQYAELAASPHQPPPRQPPHGHR
jgi:hypothetical protein